MNHRLEQLISILEQGSVDPFIRYAIATEYLKEKQFELAIQYYEDLVTNNPEYVGTYYHLGKLYYELGRQNDAEETFQKGIVVAREAKQMHALSELQQIYKSITSGFEEEEDWD